MQKNENDHMQKQLTELKKEKSLMQQQIMAASQKIHHLEEQVGLWMKYLEICVFFRILF